MSGYVAITHCSGWCQGSTMRSSMRTRPQVWTRWMEVSFSKRINLMHSFSQQVDFLQLAQEYDTKLDDNFKEWIERYKETDLTGACFIILKFWAHNSNPMVKIQDVPFAWLCFLCKFKLMYQLRSDLTSRSVTDYARLVMYSFDFQNAFKRGLQPGDKAIIDKVLHSRSWQTKWS